MRSENREHRRTERKLRRSSEQALQAQQERARQRLEGARRRVDDTDMRQHNAIVTGVLPRIQGAVDSWCRKKVRMRIESSAPRFYAATDFTEIVLGLSDDQISVDFLGDLRGLAYHEAGHIRKTVPFPTLRDMVEAAGQPVAAPENLTTELLQKAWNILEDQRMETAMVVESKNLGRYYNVIVLTHVIRELNPYTYAWLAAREHVDADVHEAAREALVASADEATAEWVEDIVWQYVETTDPVIMWDSIVKLARFLNERDTPSMNYALDQHVEFDGEAKGDTQDTLDESATPRPAKNTEATESGESGAGDEASDGGAGAGDFGSKINEAIERARQERNADRNLANDLRSYNEAVHDSGNHTPLPRVPTTYRNTSTDDMALAIRVNRSLRLLMEAARSEHAPSWQGGQRTGVLDVIRYKTRQTGDMEFFRNEATGGDMHMPNLAVSMLLDGSGSMNEYVTDLGIAAYATKTACDACSVPCTVTVYDSQAHLLWDAEDRPVSIPDAFCPLGGTDPTDALDVVDAQLHDKDRHLILLMTDGAWHGWGAKSLADYQLPGRDIVVLFWKTKPTRIPGLEQVTSAQIDSLMEIPQIVRRYLVQSM